MNTIIALVMGLSITFGGVTETTTFVNANAGTKTVVTTTISGEEYEEHYNYNHETNEWVLVEEA